MPLHSFTAFSRANRQLIYRLILGHLLWSGVVLGLWLLGGPLKPVHPLWTVVATALQLYLATQLLVLVLRYQPENRSRGYYLFWGALLVAIIWLLNQVPTHPILTAVNSGALLLIATLIGSTLARYVRRLWELIPLCLAMSLADFASWSYGPTATFSAQIKDHYLTPGSPAPLIDMFLIKLALPGQSKLLPVFGISDWIMVVFFASVAHRYGITANLAGTNQAPTVGRYLPLASAALFGAILLAQLTGAFIPALPIIALIVLPWYFLAAKTAAQ